MPSLSPHSVEVDVEGVRQLVFQFFFFYFFATPMRGAAGYRINITWGVGLFVGEGLCCLGERETIIVTLGGSILCSTAAVRGM